MEHPRFLVNVADLVHLERGYQSRLEPIDLLHYILKIFYSYKTSKLENNPVGSSVLTSTDSTREFAGPL